MLDEEEFHAWVLGSVFQMTSLMLHENRSHLSQMNAIGELCAQFTRGILAFIRGYGVDKTVKTVEAYHRLHPEAATKAWHPDVFEAVSSPEWQQLYVNAEHDGNVGVISIGRESYNADVDAELNRAIDWLKAAGVERVIVTSDFHLSTQMVGADTNEFYPALEDAEKGVEISRSWSETARRLHTEFSTSVGFVNGKRCLGGFAELLTHCHYLVAAESAELGFPEVTLPVVPGMEGCHWTFRKSGQENWPKLLKLLLEGSPVKAPDAVGWLVDFAGPVEDAVRMSWKIATGDHQLTKRAVHDGMLEDVTAKIPSLKDAGSPLVEAGRKAIVESIRESCGAMLGDALHIQAKHSGGFMTSKACLSGTIGAMYKRAKVT
jgi:enoyl-CoA hydratase/carnithine racemase